MRLLLSTYDSRGGLEPLVGIAMRLRALGAEVRVCAPSDTADERPLWRTIRTDEATVAATLLLDRSR